MDYSIVSISLPAGDTPVCGVTLSPYVRLKKADNSSVSPTDLPNQGGALDSRHGLAYRWYRSKFLVGGKYCVQHPERPAGIECLVCLKLGVPSIYRYFCTAKCYRDQWSRHKDLHLQYQGSSGLANGVHNSYKIGTSNSTSDTPWLQVGAGLIYTPNIEDVGHLLKFEVSLVDPSSGLPLSDAEVHSHTTEHVRHEPQPPERSLIRLHPRSLAGEKVPQLQQVQGSFTVLTYNLLADLYACGSSHYSRCPQWVLNWEYRKRNLLKEILQYSPDVICLQEMQSGHYHGFFQSELARRGYNGIFKPKTAEMFTGKAYDIDGCATFFRRDRFTLAMKYEVEFNKAASSIIDQLPQEHRTAALNRLRKGNVALIVVLDTQDHLAVEAAARGARSSICVANTHIHANPKLSDIKLWQVSTLLRGLEKIANSVDIPIIIAGDMNTMPGSAPHDLLVKGQVLPGHQDLKLDPIRILDPARLRHQLRLSSCYSAVLDAPAGGGPELAQLRRQVDPQYGEPRFTNMTDEFTGTLDYILYTSASLRPTAVLELPAPDEVRQTPDGTIPNASWSSDHIALMAAFQMHNGGPD